jgi:hypothetical protein
MANFDAGSIEVNDVTIPIQVDTEGNWLAVYDGRTLRYPTRDKLEGALKRLTKRASVTVSVPVVKIEKGVGGVARTRATATGIHGANGNVLVTLHYGGRRGDVKEQENVKYSYSAGLWFGGDVTDEQIIEFGRLIKVAQEARQAVDDMEKKLRIDLLKAVETAVQAQSGTDEE